MHAARALSKLDTQRDSGGDECVGSNSCLCCVQLGASKETPPSCCIITYYVCVHLFMCTHMCIRVCVYVSTRETFEGAYGHTT